MNEKEQIKSKSEGEKPKKELSPEQLQKRKKMVIFPLLFLLFAASMWLIFAPKGGDEAEQTDGFNTELPVPKENGIVNDKRTAYEQEAMQTKEQAKMRSLQDFAFSLGEESETEEERIAREERQARMAPKPIEYYENPERFSGGGSSSSYTSTNDYALRSSANAYQDINRQLGSWYDEPATEEDEQSKLELEWRIQELERQLQEKSAADQQLELIEKSYAIAAKYMPQAQGQVEEQTAAVSINAMGNKPTVEPVSQVSHSVVSLLAAPMTDSVFVEEYSKERNWGFNSVAKDELPMGKNSINACVYKTVTLTDGQEVGLRLLEPMRAGKVLIPTNTIVTGTARISGERMSITVHAVQHRGIVIPVELLVYDMDGGEGVSVPGSEELNAIKEVAANMGTSMGSSITITDDAGSQLLADLGRSAIQGASQYVGKKMRTVKVTLKAGHRVLLLPPLK